MTSSIGLAGVFANLVVLLALTAALASRRVSELARVVVATFAFSLAWVVTAGFDVMRAPDWAMFMGGGVLAVSIVVVIAAVHRWTQSGDGAQTQPEHRGDEDEGGPRRHWPDAPQHGGGGSDPSWWPEFERRLALYVAGRERENRQPAVPD